MDFLSPTDRSKRMSLIRGRDTKPELVVRRYLHAQGMRFTLHSSGLPGHPDIVLPKYSVVVFVHGCFWHAHRCQKGRIPATRSAFWKEKLERNGRRDKRNARALRKMGWHVFHVWECEVATQLRRQQTLSRLERRIRRSLEEARTA
ncbi:MAG: very short patch repair endonuclease [Luteimonas sp.]